MAKIKIIVLEGNPERAATLTQIFEGAGKHDLVISKVPRDLMNLMDGRGEVKLVITNTTITHDELDGLLVNVIGRHHWPLDKIIPRLKTRQGRLAQRVIRIADAASYAMGYGMLRSDGTPLKSNPNSSTRPASPRKISTSGRRRSATISPLPLRRWAASEIYSLPP